MGSYNFAGAVATVPAYGQRTKVKFAGTWVAGDTWSIPVTSTVTGEFTVGKGNIAGQTLGAVFKLRNRMYLGMGSSFALSSNGDTTLWEEQDPGAGSISYLSQFGPQDTIVGFASIQGRLAVIGRQTIQIWVIDADPANFALQQTLDSSGALSVESIKSIGDLDVLYLDSSGIRSLRAKESTLNAFVNDIGTAIDLLIRTDLVSVDGSAACGIVEPTTRQYWLFLNANIYVLSYYPESKIIAWSTYKATTSVTGTQTAFTPEKMVVYNRQVYIRSTSGVIYQYGGSGNNTYDNCRATVELPWLVTDKNPEVNKQFTGVDIAWTGNWKLEASTNPRGSMVTVIDRGSGASPSMVADSTYDIGHFTMHMFGTHLKLKATSGNYTTAAKLGQISVQYNVSTNK